MINGGVRNSSLGGPFIKLDNVYINYIHFFFFLRILDRIQKQGETLGTVKLITSILHTIYKIELMINSISSTKINDNSIIFLIGTYVI